MKKEISPVSAAIIIVIVVAVLLFAGYRMFLQPKAPKWTPPPNYGASTYGPTQTPR